MSRASTLARGRKFAEALMTDTCVISRKETARDPDPATGKREETSTPIYTGACEFVAADTQARSTESAGRELTQQGAVLKIPVAEAGSELVTAGDEAVVTLRNNGITTSTVTARISAGHHQTAAIERRLPVEVTSNG